MERLDLQLIQTPVPVSFLYVNDLVNHHDDDDDDEGMDDGCSDGCGGGY